MVEKLSDVKKTYTSAEFIVSDSNGVEAGYIDSVEEMDIDIGGTNEFSFQLDIGDYTHEKYGYGCRFFIPGTEYGGVIECLEPSTADNIVVLSGYTWRGLLTQKVIAPPTTQEHVVLNGEVNTVIGELVSGKFNGLFVVSKEDSGVILKNYEVPRFVTLYDAIMGFLEKNDFGLEITYVQPNTTNTGYVLLKAVPIIDWSDELEYSRDGTINFRIKDDRKGINHLVCAGEGGIKRLEELRNKQTFEVTIEEYDVNLGDIVGGREEVTGLYVKKPIVRKIINLENGIVKVQYETKGDDQ